jgi:hypothetical protein
VTVEQKLLSSSWQELAAYFSISWVSLFVIALGIMSALRAARFIVDKVFGDW